jgi:excisionase family DNA binding protein
VSSTQYRFKAATGASIAPGISRTSMYQLITDRKLRTVKIGRRRFVPREAIEEFIAGLSA